MRKTLEECFHFEIVLYLIGLDRLRDKHLEMTLFELLDIVKDLEKSGYKACLGVLIKGALANYKIECDLAELDNPMS